MRLFLALELPEAARERLGALQDRLRPICSGWRWLPPEQIHLTLRFLGEVDEASDRLQRELWRRAAIAVPAVRFRIGSAGVLPNRSRPRVLYAAVLESATPGPIGELARSLETAARAQGFAAEERPFRPHLTLARARRDGTPACPPDAPGAPEIELECSALTLFRSELSSHGARYTALERFPLLRPGLDPSGPSRQHATMKARTIAVLGGGAWGTALAVHLAGHGHLVRLWMRQADAVRRMRERRDNPVHLPGVTVPQGVEPSADLAQVLDGADLAIAAVPSPYAREVYTRALPAFPRGAPLVVAIKGLEESTGALPEEVVRAELGPEVATVILSGPSFAPEVARGLPTAVVAASVDPVLARTVQEVLSGRALRVYTSEDPRGVQLAGALKNVIAIAAGAAEGAGLGHGATATLLTRGLSEIRRLGVALGGRGETFHGLAGMGDLVLTCTGAPSRNRRLGEALGRGERLQGVVAGSASVVEGVRTARVAGDLARRNGIAVPIIDEVCRLLFDDGSARDSLERLMARPLTAEEPIRAEPGP